jgi:hypothetical protein
MLRVTRHRVNPPAGAGLRCALLVGRQALPGAPVARSQPHRVAIGLARERDQRGLEKIPGLLSSVLLLFSGRVGLLRLTGIA